MFLIDLHFGQEHATVVGGDTEDMIIVLYKIAPAT